MIMTISELIQVLSGAARPDIEVMIEGDSGKLFSIQEAYFNRDNNVYVISAE